MRWEVHAVEDSFKILRSADADEFDVTITDPPYDAHVHENMSSGTAMKKFVEGGGGGGIPRKELPFAPLEGHEFAVDLLNATKRWVLIFSSVESFGEFKRAVTPPHWVRGMFWYKPNSMGQLTGDRPAAAFEGISLMHGAGKKVWNGRGSFGVYQAEEDPAHFVANGTRGEKERHPNQKPLRLCLELVAKYSNRGETVFDPFCGSARIGEACVLLGRHYVGLDLPPGKRTSEIDWPRRARDRLRRAERLGFGALSDEECLHLCRGPTERDLPPLPELVHAIARS